MSNPIQAIALEKGKHYILEFKADSGLDAGHANDIIEMFKQKGINVYPIITKGRGKKIHVTENGFLED